MFLWILWHSVPCCAATGSHPVTRGGPQSKFHHFSGTFRQRRKIIADTEQTEIQIIRATYSAAPPDPCADDVEETFDAFLWENEVLVAAEYPKPDYNWSRARVELIADAVDEKRYDELRGGVEPTPDEVDAFQKAAEREAERARETAWSAHVFRVSAPPESGEHRAVFFTWTGIVSAQDQDINFCGGPFRDIVEAVLFFYEREGEPDLWLEKADFPERLRFDEWLTSRGEAAT